MVFRDQSEDDSGPPRCGPTASRESLAGPCGGKQNGAAIERVLLLCSGRGYCFGDDQFLSTGDVQQQTWFTRQVREGRNGKPNAGTDAEVLQTLGQFYEALVPSVLLDEKGTPLEGDAQSSRRIRWPAYGRTQRGFPERLRENSRTASGWVVKMTTGAAGWESESTAWLESVESQQLQRATGSPPAWVRKLRAGQPWQESFVADEQKKRKELNGVPTLIRRLKADLGLLPLMRPPGRIEVYGLGGWLDPRDRLALRLAVAHLLSWESWNHRAASEHSPVTQRVVRQEEEISRFGDLIGLIREYEDARHEQLRRVALADDANPFRIGLRTIRAWDRIREEWLARGDSCALRLQVLVTLQAKLSGRFGDPDLFRWLAADGRECLSQGPRIRCLHWRGSTLSGGSCKGNGIEPCTLYPIHVCIPAGYLTNPRAGPTYGTTSSPLTARTSPCRSLYSASRTTACVRGLQG